MGWADLSCDGVPDMNKGETAIHNAELFCDDCISLYMTEEKQIKLGLKENHLCCEYRIKLKHEGYHPHIKRPEFCIEEKKKRTIGVL